MDESGVVRQSRDRIARLGVKKASPHPRKPPAHHELTWRLAAMRPEHRLEVAVTDAGHCAQAAERDRVRKMGIDPLFDNADALDSQRGRGG